MARTVTSTVRLLDTLEVFRADPRVQVVFWVDEGSRFGRGVRDLLSRVGAPVVARHELSALEVGLVLAASENADVGVVDAPGVVLPHGVGFHKYLRDVPSGPVRLSGVVPREPASGRETIMVVTSHRQRAQLESALPGAGTSTVVVRDPFFDRLRASRTLRDRYRRAMGVRRGRRLVVVTSTWGQESLWSAWQDLPARLLAELPSDEYLVAAILHPNVWAGHGPWQVRTWLADALDAGLLLVPADQGWQQALVSADIVIGDHGSVTFYAAALGLPLLLGAFGDEVVPGTPLAELGALVPRLRWDRSLLPQVTRALSVPAPAPYAAVAQAAFGVGEPGSFTDLGQFLYGLLGLTPPAHRPPQAWAYADLTAPPVASFTVFSHTDADGAAVLRRHPAAVSSAASQVGEPAPSPATSASRHLAVYDDETDVGRRQSASTLVCRDVLDREDADEWLALHRERHLITAVPTRQGILVADRYGGLFLVTVNPRSGPRTWFEPMHAAAVVHHLLCNGTTRPSERDGEAGDERSDDNGRRAAAGVTVPVKVAGRGCLIRLTPIRPTTRPEVRSTTQSATQSATRPEVRSTTQSEVRSATQSATPPHPEAPSG